MLMGIDLNNVTEDDIKRVWSDRIPHMHLLNHGSEFSPWMNSMLESAMKIEPFIDVCEEESKDNDKT